MNQLLIGIDPGVKTGFAVVQSKLPTVFVELTTLPIHLAMQRVKFYVDTYGIAAVVVKFEDARRRNWFGNSSTEKHQGAGSIKRDCKIWEDYLTYLEVPYIPVKPIKGATKLTHLTFQKITGIKTRTTSIHSRDAAMLVYNHTTIQFSSKANTL